METQNNNDNNNNKENNGDTLLADEHHLADQDRLHPGARGSAEGRIAGASREAVRRPAAAPQAPR